MTNLTVADSSAVSRAVAIFSASFSTDPLAVWIFASKSLALSAVVSALDF
jgi:hypothetical protein